MTPPPEPDSVADASGARRRYRVCVVGSGMRFVSGLSHYTYFLSRSLAEEHDVSVILERNLVPRLLYPGKSRVGTEISSLATAEFAPTFDGLDWYGIPSLWQATRFLRRQRPEVLVLEWWSAACLPGYLALSRCAKKLDIPMVLELHEDLHPAEAKVPVLGPAGAWGLRRLITSASRFVVHSEWSRDRFSDKYGIKPDRISVVPLGPFGLVPPHDVLTRRRNDADPITILFFGTIRPYKGLEDLVDAFDLLCESEEGRWQLLVVGEPWENWTLPLDKISRSVHRDAIGLVDRYVRDDELASFFGRADLVALPYVESAASGPLHLTMATGLPVVVTEVGGLVSAVADYKGGVLVPPSNPEALALGIKAAAELAGHRHEDPHSWERTNASFRRTFDNLCAGPRA